MFGSKSFSSTSSTKTLFNAFTCSPPPVHFHPKPHQHLHLSLSMKLPHAQPFTLHNTKLVANALQSRLCICSSPRVDCRGLTKQWLRRPSIISNYKERKWRCDATSKFWIEVYYRNHTCDVSCTKEACDLTPNCVVRGPNLYISGRSSDSDVGSMVRGTMRVLTFVN